MAAPVHYECAVLGDWHLAFITAASLARLGHRTVLVNPGLPGKPAWSGFPTLALHEPELPETIAAARQAGRLDAVGAIRGSEGEAWTANFVWLAIDTPVDEQDDPDTSVLLDAAMRVATAGACRQVFVVTSQVPVGFCSSLEGDLGLTTAYVPENLRLGRGLETFLRADRLVVGASAPATARRVRDLLAGVEADVLLCDLPTAEMVKHATNAFLATSISFANQLARIGERRGVDNQAVAAALKLDKRIGPLAYVAPGLGFAGGTLPRDLRVLQRVGRAEGVPTSLFDAVLEVNESTAAALFDSVTAHVGALLDKDILLLGYSYKAETDTLRRSASLELGARLKQAGARVLGFDPFMNGRDLSALHGIIEHRTTWASLDRAPAATVVMTPRSDFASLDWGKLGATEPTGTKAPLVLDARDIVSRADVLRAGFAYKALWQPVHYPDGS